MISREVPSNPTSARIKSSNLFLTCEIRRGSRLFSPKIVERGTDFHRLFEVAALCRYAGLRGQESHQVHNSTLRKSIARSNTHITHNAHNSQRTQLTQHTHHTHHTQRTQHAQLTPHATQNTHNSNTVTQHTQLEHNHTTHTTRTQSHNTMRYSTTQHKSSMPHV
jgi:hypothetical protein